MKIITKMFKALPLVVIAGLLYSNAAWASIGKAMYVSGSVKLETPAIKKLKRRGLVNEGDVIVTGKRGFVQLLLDDGTKIAIRRNSRFVVEALEMPATPATATKPARPAIGAGKTLRARFSLQKGGFRTITGRISKRKPAAYQLRTPSAVIRVRGTNYSAQYCQGDCGGGTGPAADDGLYVGVSAGGVTLSNNGGDLDLSVNQYGYAESFNAQPQRLLAPPSVLNEEGQAVLDEEEEADDESSDDEEADEESSDEEADAESSDEESADEESSDEESTDSESSDDETADEGSDSSDEEAADESGTESSDEGGTEESSSDEVSSDEVSSDEGSAEQGSSEETRTETASAEESSSDESVSVDSSSTVDSGTSGTSGTDSGTSGSGEVSGSTESRSLANEFVTPDAVTEVASVTSTTADVAPVANEPVAPDQEVVAETETGVVVDITDGELEIVTRPLAIASQGFAESLNTNSETALFDAEEQLISFQVPDANLDPITFSIGTANNVNTGLDPITEMKWGRWSEGVAQSTTATQTTQIDLSSGSLHWIIAPLEDAPSQLITGSADYVLVGNTDPTDDLGNVGILGSASFSANFTAATVTSNVQLGINDQVWKATGDGAINANLFSGLYSTVTIDGVLGGSGSFAGTFTNFNGADIPGGAGLVFDLSNGVTNVNGAAVFNKSGSQQ